VKSALYLTKSYPLNPILLVIISTVVTVITISAIALSVYFGQAHFEKLGLINFASVVLFVVFCLFSLSSTKLYFFFLPFIFIAFPAAVNDFFPSILLGHPDEIGASAFPLITHIDFFLLLGIVKAGIANRLYIRSNLLLVTVSFLFLMSFAVNILETSELQGALLLAAGLFPLRYLLLIVVLLSNYDIKPYERQIIFSLVAAVFFLFVESLVNTAVSKNEALVSGTLGANTFANVIVSILMFFLFVKRKNFPINNLLFLALVACSILIILMTGTRIAIVAGIITFFLLQAYLFNWYKTVLVLIWVGIMAIGVYNFIEVPERYSFTYLSSKIHLNVEATEPANVVFVEASEETNSFRTRLRLYGTALYMLIKNPVWGTGYGTFNYLKGEYGFKDLVLIDAHNGYLNTLAQLGFSSVFLLYFVYFYPILNFREFQAQTFLSSLAIINLTMAVCDISNAGIYKPPVFALLAFNAVLISMFKKENSSA